MSDRDKLIELIKESVGGCATYWASLIADHLIANGVTLQRWIPVSERLPEDGELAVVTYLRYDNGMPASDGIAYRDRGCWYWRFDDPEDDEIVCVEITNWMPLPEPPKGE